MDRLPIMDMKKKEYLYQLAFLIKKQRLKQGITQEQLSFMCNMHRNQISLIERGLKDIRLSTLLSLLYCLDISGEEIIALKSFYIMDE